MLEARAAAQAALHYAKLQKAANETQADCLAMIKRAEIRMADEIDAAQARGDVARPTDSLRQNTVARNSGNGAVTYDELGVTGQRVAEWRELRELPTGQRLLYERLTSTGACSVVIVVGDAVDASAIFHEGERFPPRGYEPADLETIKRDLAAWSEWAARHPATILPRPDRP